MPDSMRLKWIPINAAYAFTWHGQLIRLDNAPMFYATKREARQEAARLGLHVDTRGFVEATHAE
jgi:hypothetical protein